MLFSSKYLHLKVACIDGEARSSFRGRSSLVDNEVAPLRRRGQEGTCDTCRAFSLPLMERSVWLLQNQCMAATVGPLLDAADLYDMAY